MLWLKRIDSKQGAKALPRSQHQAAVLQIASEPNELGIGFCTNCRFGNPLHKRGCTLTSGCPFRVGGVAPRGWLALGLAMGPSLLSASASVSCLCLRLRLCLRLCLCLCLRLCQLLWLRAGLGRSLRAGWVIANARASKGKKRVWGFGARSVCGAGEGVIGFKRF